MKIVHFAKFYPPEFGGIESVTQALAEDHSASGHDVDVICFTRNSQQFEKMGQVNLIRIKVKMEFASQPLAMSYLKACASAAQNADIVHVHTPNILAALAVLRLPNAVKVVIHWHADIENKGLLGRLVRPIERAMLRRADKVVTTTEVYAKASSALKDLGSRVNAIPIGIADIEKVSSCAITEVPYVLFVGRLVPYKGLNVLMEAAAKVKGNIEFRIVGIGPELSELKSQVKRLGVSDRVKFLGRVGERQLQEIMQGAAIFCLPSINRLEAFGVVLLEAMRAGLAVVSSDIPGSGVSWVNSTGLNVPVKDPKALAEAIDRLLANPQERERLGRRARLRFESEFQRELMVKRFLEIYMHLVEQSAVDSKISHLNDQIEN